VLRNEAARRGQIVYREALVRKTRYDIRRRLRRALRRRGSGRGFVGGLLCMKRCVNECECDAEYGTEPDPVLKWFHSAKL
jgi:hypothetical protein